MKNEHSKLLFQRANKVIPGGVNSPVRAFRNVQRDPLFIQRAQGAYVFDADNNRYIDYVGSWGPMIAGHAHPEIITAVQKAIQNGLSYGAPTEIEIKLAEKICEIMPNIEQVRMVNSGTEATMSAIRLARGITGRQKIMKFEGCYHGHSDSLLVKAGSGALTFGIPDSAGVPADLAQHTLVAQYNDLSDVERLFKDYGTDIACIIIEPVAGNMGCVLPINNFLKGMREICDRYNSLLIFDEVITGFRVALGGATERYQVIPDIITLGKIIGGGMPVGAFGGKREIMQHISPCGPVYQAGTLSGNPVAMTAGLATLKIIQQPGFYEQLEKMTTRFISGLQQLAQAANIALVTHQVGSLFGFFFTQEQKVETYSDVKKSNLKLFKAFFAAMIEDNIYFAPSAFESGFVSSAHTKEDIDQTLNSIEKFFAQITKHNNLMSKTNA